MGAASFLISAAGRLGGASALLAFERLRLGRDYIRVLAYHGTPVAAAASLERHLDFLARRFSPAGEEGLLALISGRASGRMEKPGVLLSFDDGLRSNYEVAVPLLERYGFRGLFFLTSSLPGLPEADHARFCDENAIRRHTETGRIGMNWEEARDLLARGHAVGCHTSSHRRFRGPAANGDFEREIAGAKASMEDALGARVASYAWVGGETDTYSAPAYGSIASAGFALAFTTKSLAAVPGANPLSIHRTVVDADMDIGAFALKASGLMDPIKAADRRTIEGRFS